MKYTLYSSHQINQGANTQPINAFGYPAFVLKATGEVISSHYYFSTMPASYRVAAVLGYATAIASGVATAVDVPPVDLSKLDFGGSESYVFEEGDVFVYIVRTDLP